MSKSNKSKSSDAFRAFEQELARRLGNVDLTGTSSNKFEALVKWVAPLLNFEEEAVVCKFAPGSKNIWNRVREGFRRRPKCLLLILEAEVTDEVVARLQEGCALCADLQLLVVAQRAGDEGVSLRIALTRSDAVVPLALREAGQHMEVHSMSAKPSSARVGLRSPPQLTSSENVKKELLGLGSIFSGRTPRQAVVSSLASLTGVPAEQIVIKSVGDAFYCGLVVVT